MAESNQSDHGQMLLTSENNKSTEVDAQTKSETSTNKNALGGFRFSGQHYESKVYREQLKTSFSNLGGQAHRNNTTRISTDGYISVKGKQIPLKPLHKQ